ncbi:MAG TPA: MFS transporter [Anaerolineae bacterium]|nr:MFS transporter [Anaerolineae bacterium]
MPPKLTAYPTYLIISFVFSLNFTLMSMISAIYRVESAGLNPLQLILVGTVLELAVFIFEIPTGIVADIYSRRLSIIIGYTLIGLGFIVEASWTYFPTILLAQAIWGFGYTFISGAQDAWLADELGQQHTLPAVYLRGLQYDQAGRLVGLIFATWLGAQQLARPLLIGGLGCLTLALFLYLFMPENNFTPTPPSNRSNWQTMRATAHTSFQLIYQRPLLRAILLITLFAGLASEPLDRFWEAHILINYTLPPLPANLTAFTASLNSPLASTVTWFGLLNLCLLAINILLANFVRQYLDHQTKQLIPTLLIINILIILGVIFFALAPSFGWVLFSYFLMATMRTIDHPLYMAWLNKDLPSATRATILSFSGQLNALGQIVGGLIIGLIATRYNLPLGFLLAALFLLPIPLIYAYQHLLNHSNHEKQ